MQIVKRKRVIALVLAACMLMGISLTASAANDYDLNITYPFQGSKKWTDAYTKTTNATPYVKPKINTISTCYYLSTGANEETLTTNIITTSNTSKKEFTWKSGYGGINTSFRLCAYPGIMTNYDPYNVRGEWSE